MSRRLDVPRLLAALSVAAERDVDGAHWRARCPSPDHDDSDPSWRIVDRQGERRHGSHKCFAFETEVLTWDGPRAIGELAGQVAKVLTLRGQYPRWVEAPFRSFGVQSLWRVVLRRNGVRKTIRATAEHRWFVRVSDGRGPVRWAERTTERLSPGHRLRVARFSRSGTLSPSPWGVARGFTYGDGTRVRGYGSKAVLWGEKDSALLRFFPLSPRREVETANGVSGVEVSGLPSYFKELPDIEESPSYLYGWLSGYFAADGSVSKGGMPTMASARRKDLEFVRRICVRLGIFTYGISEQRRRGRGKVDSSLYSLSFSRRSLSADFFQVENHRRRWAENRDVIERPGWVVESIEPLGEREEVFCATVFETGSFALWDNVLTGNCWSCGFAGGPWELVAAVRGIELSEAGEWIRALGRGEARTDVEAPRVVVQLPGDESPGYRLPTGVSVPSVDGSRWFPPALQYLRGRAVNDAQIARWGIGFATIGEVAMRVVVPVRTRGRLVSHVARAFTAREPRYHVPRSDRRGARNGEALFGEPELREELGIVIPCEGVFGHLRLELAGAPNPVAVLGAQNLGPFKVAILSAFPRVFVAADPDAAGDSLVEAIRRGVGRASTVERLELERSPDDSTVPEIRAALRRAGVV